MTYSTTLSVVTADVFTEVELRTVAGFLGGYSGLTRDAYALDLRQFAQWCHDCDTGLFTVARSDIEAFARNLEDLGRAAPQSHAGCARSLPCTGTRSRKDSSTGHQPFTSAGPASNTGPTRQASTATRSAQCSSPPAWPGPAITP